MPLNFRSSRWETLRTTANPINKTRPEFSIHVGDIWGATLCIKERCEEIRETFRLFDHPVVYTPGDNEWTDCSRTSYGGFEPQTRLVLLREVFFSSDDTQGAHSMKVVRQSTVSPFEEYSENARWLHENVLFFTLNISGSENDFVYDDSTQLKEAHDRNEANIAWLRDGFRIARENNLPGVVIAFHAEMFPNEYAEGGRRTSYMPIIRELQLAADRFPNPILLIHGDTHAFIVDRPFAQQVSETEPLQRGHVVRLEVFGSPEIRAVQVSVDTESRHLFGFTPVYNQ